jgi:HD-GYP domain-containing protein (c-di-GMP phosphodiesterase class II)
MGLSPSRVLDVELGALLHDVGKIGVRDAVLLKPGPLTEDEWVEMRKHPDLGVALLTEVPALRRALPIVQCHHERRDGKGYPRALVGNAIPLDARIFQVVDAYDAIVSDRPYRKGRSDAEARAEIAQHVGPQFDPEVFEAFNRIPALDWQSVIRSKR